VVIFHQISYPFIHDLAALITILMEKRINVPDRVKESARLTRFAVAARYPGILSPVSANEYHLAVQLAEEVLQWSESLIVPHRK
jgi:HEPN domain-containing protein